MRFLLGQCARPAAGLARRWRGTGAELPFADPFPAHGVRFEGWYVRVADPRRGLVAAVMLGVVRDDDGSRWAHVNLAVHPGGEVRSAVVGSGVTDGGGTIGAGSAVLASARRWQGRVDDLELELSARPTAVPRPALWGALGPAHLLPAFPQYWTPTLVGVVEQGTLGVRGRRQDLAGARVYAEKNWGRSFPRGGWWWGAAHAFADPALAVAFAGGPLTRRGPAPTALVAATADGAIRLGTPGLSPVLTTTGAGWWRVEGRGGRHRVRLLGEAAGSAVLLPHPEPPGRRLAARARQELAGRVEAVVERRGGGRWRIAHRGESPLAGLERGDDAAAATGRARQASAQASGGAPSPSAGSTSSGAWSNGSEPLR